MVVVSTAVKNALNAALAARARAHAPYSRFTVGAALKLKGSDELIAGCNVENASFGAAICAERGAVLQAVARFGPRPEFEFLVVATGEANATPPCGLCLQVLAEFVQDDFPVYLGNPGGVVQMHAFGDLLPKAFRSFKAMS